LVKLAFHDADTDTDILVARMSACRSACHSNKFNRAVGRVGDDPREEIGVGIVECEL